MVSVCIATYNGEKFIREQLESILIQLEPYDEIIISDDGSTDNTIQIIESLNDKRIKIFHHSKRKIKYKFDYTTHNFENAILHSKGDIIMFSDQDDIWLANKYSVVVSSLKEADIVVSDCKMVDSNLNILCESRFNQITKSNRILMNFISARNLGCCLSFKRCVLEKVLPFPKYGVAQDYWIAVFGSLFYKFKYINEPLILYRRHNQTVSATGGKSIDSVTYKIGYRLRFLFSIFTRGTFLRIIKQL